MKYVLIAAALLISGCGSTLFNTNIDNPHVKSCIQWQGSGRGTLAPGFTGIVSGVTVTGDGDLEQCIQYYSTGGLRGE